MTEKPETVKEEDLIKRKDGLYYKKYAKVPFTGLVKPSSKYQHFLGNLHYKNGKKNEDLWESFHPNGSVRFRARGKKVWQGNVQRFRYAGLWEEFRDTGELLNRGNYKNGKILNYYETFYKNRQIDLRINIEKTKKTEQQFHSNGQRAVITIHENGKKTGSPEVFNEKGKNVSNGFFENFYENREIRRRGNYRKGEKHGHWETFKENGQLFTKAIYKNGILHGLYESFHVEGQVLTKGKYKNGEKEGYWETFNEDATYWGKGSYKQGQKEGLWKSKFTPNGFREFVNFVNDQGVFWVKETYRSGLLQGPREMFNKEGNLVIRANYKNDLHHGTWQWFDLNGHHVVETQTYKKGELQSSDVDETFTLSGADIDETRLNEQEIVKRLSPKYGPDGIEELTHDVIGIWGSSSDPFETAYVQYKFQKGKLKII